MIPTSFVALIIVINFAQKMNQLMSEYIIYLKLDPYLAQWLIHEHGGTPVAFPKNSMENDIIELGLMKKPYLALPNEPGENKVPIALPYFKSKNVRYNNYLSLKSRNALQRCIRSRFVMTLWKDLYKFGYIGKKKQDLIWAWMETHGIEATDTNFNTIAKIYLRKRNVYRDAKRREEKRLEKEESDNQDLNNVKKPTA